MFDDITYKKKLFKLSMKNCYRNVATITNLFFVYLLIILHNVTKSNEVLFSMNNSLMLFLCIPDLYTVFSFKIPRWNSNNF